VLVVAGLGDEGGDCVGCSRHEKRVQPEVRA